MYRTEQADAGSFANVDASCDLNRGISTKEILRELIAQEVRSGRLTPSRRRRIVDYAAQLRLSAVEAGRLIAECRDEALESEDAEVIYHALRLVEPPTRTTPIAVKFAVALAVAIVLYELGAKLF